MKKNGSAERRVVEKIKLALWKWYNHALRMPEERITKQALNWKPEGRRRVGRPKDTLRCTLTREINLKNLQEDDVSRRAEDRVAWRSFVADLWTT